MTFLDKKPEVEQEMADEIKAAETELAAEDAAKKAAEAKAETPAPEPEPESDDEGGEPEKDAAEAEEGAEGEDETKGQVPRGALIEERKKRQEYERELSKLQGQMETLMSALQGQGQQQKPEDEAKLPDPEEDPIGALRYMANELHKLQQSTQQQTETTQLQTAYQTAAKQYAAQTPDFKDAYQHLIQSRANELRTWGKSDAEVAQIVAQEEIALAQSAFQAGRNPGEMIYEMAKMRGYTKSQEQETPASQAPPDPAAVMEKEQAKKNAATNIGTGGRAQKNTVTDKDLADMTGADFDKSWEKVFPKSNSMFGA